jgi:hypothetical protein
MSDEITKTRRWLDLVAFLAARGVSASMEEVMKGVPEHATPSTQGAG